MYFIESTKSWIINGAADCGTNGFAISNMDSSWPGYSDSWACYPDALGKMTTAWYHEGDLSVPSVVCSEETRSRLSSTSCALTTTTTTIAFTYSYTAGSWSSCSASCGGGTQTRSVTCQQFNPMNFGRRQLLQPGAPGSTPWTTGAPGSVVSDSYCSGTKPSTSQSCNTQACATPSTTASPTTTKPADEAPTTSYTYAFSEGSFGSCSESCGGGTRTRTVTCLRDDGQAVADTMCSGTKPSTSDSCNNQSCNTTSSASKLAQAFHVIAFLALAVVIIY